MASRRGKQFKPRTMNRSSIAVWIALGLLALLGASTPAIVRADEPLQLEVRETVGLRRYAYPVTAEFRSNWGPADAVKLRVRDGERSVSAQFTLLEPAQAGQAALWAADFSIDLAPLESRRLRVELAPAAPRQEPRPGLQVEARDGLLHVHSKSLEYVVPEKLEGLLSAMRVSGEDWLAGPAGGLVASTRRGSDVPLRVPSAGDTAEPWRIVKPGPLAVTLERKWTQPLDGQQTITCRVRLDCPLGKSWVRVDCAVEDSRDAIASLSGALRLRLEATGKQPILADMGAGGWTYAALQPGESLVYRAGDAASGPPGSIVPDWRVDRVRAGRAEPFAIPTDPPQLLPVPGWAHLSDVKRATAIAMDAFASKADSIELSADGRVKLARAYGPHAESERVPKRLSFWLHFVSAPAQWGAATSPQSMLAPPEVHVVGASTGAASQSE